MGLLSFIYHLVAVYLLFGVGYYLYGVAEEGSWDLTRGWFGPIISFFVCFLFHPIFFILNQKPIDRTFASCMYVLLMMLLAMVWSVL